MPDIHFFCAICGKGLTIAADFTGAVVECPACCRVVPVPALVTHPHGSAGCVELFATEVLSVEIKFLCGCCGVKLRVDARCEGHELNCPRCQAVARVPRWSRSLASATRLCPEEIEFLSGDTNFTPQPELVGGALA
jgi:hypothetical protein